MSWAEGLAAGVSLLLILLVIGVPIFVAFLILNVAGVLYLMGPAGFIGAEDGEVIEYVQDGLRQRTDRPLVLELGGGELGSVDHAVSEAAIRSMYAHYRSVMGL